MYYESKPIGKSNIFIGLDDLGLGPTDQSSMGFFMGWASSCRSSGLWLHQFFFFFPEHKFYLCVTVCKTASAVIYINFKKKLIIIKGECYNCRLWNDFLFFYFLTDTGGSCIC